MMKKKVGSKSGEMIKHTSSQGKVNYLKKVSYLVFGVAKINNSEGLSRGFYNLPCKMSNRGLLDASLTVIYSS
jgi:hypothetical protein